MVFAALVSLSFSAVKVRAIIEFRQVEKGPVLYADLLEGIDYSKTPSPYTDKKGGTIKVGIFATKDPDGTTRSLRYETKVLSPAELKMSNGNIVRCDNPDVRFLRNTIKLARRGLWYEDLQRMYQGKLKKCKSERDKALKLRRYARLYNWCNANFLFKYAEKVEKEVKRLEEPLLRAEEEKEDVAEEESGFDSQQRDEEVAEAMKALPGIGEVIVRSSKHVVIATDFIPLKTVDELLKLGERVYRDFGEFMYDESMEKSKPLPDEEILRFFYFTNIETQDTALKTARTLSYCGNYSDTQHRLRLLGMGGGGSRTLRKGYSHRTFFGCSVTGDPNDPNTIKEQKRDLHDAFVHQLGHVLMENRMRPNYIYNMGGNDLIMPWLEESMAIYLTIKHLGTKNSSCVDFAKKKSKYASTGKKREKDHKMWEGDVEKMVSGIALDDSAEAFDVIIRIPTYRRLEPETLAKGFSMIDFMIETDRVGFLNFLEKLQKHYKVLFKGKDAAAFIRGLDELVAECFADARIKKGRKFVPMESVADLEEAWREWARHYVMKKR